MAGFKRHHHLLEKTERLFICVQYFLVPNEPYEAYVTRPCFYGFDLEFSGKIDRLLLMDFLDGICQLSVFVYPVGRRRFYARNRKNQWDQGALLGPIP